MVNCWLLNVNAKIAHIVNMVGLGLLKSRLGPGPHLRACTGPIFQMMGPVRADQGEIVPQLRWAMPRC